MVGDIRLIAYITYYLEIFDHPVAEMTYDIHHRLAEELITKAERQDTIQAGIASIDRVLKGPSYRALVRGQWHDCHVEQTTHSWLHRASSLLVLAMHHQEMPKLDWFDRGNTAGNLRLTEIYRSLVKWLFQAHGIRAQDLPYQVEHGGVYLKDAAVFAGLGAFSSESI